MREEPVRQKPGGHLARPARQSERGHHAFVGHHPYRRAKRRAGAGRDARIQLGRHRIQQAIGSAECEVDELPRCLLRARIVELLADNAKRRVRHSRGRVIGRMADRLRRLRSAPGPGRAAGGVAGFTAVTQPRRDALKLIHRQRSGGPGHGPGDGRGPE